MTGSTSHTGSAAKIVMEQHELKNSTDMQSCSVQQEDYLQNGSLESQSDRKAGHLAPLPSAPVKVRHRSSNDYIPENTSKTISASLKASFLVE